MISRPERVCKSFSARQAAVAAILWDKAMLHEPFKRGHSSIVQPSIFAANEARQYKTEISPERSTSCLCYAIDRWIALCAV